MDKKRTFIAQAAKLHHVLMGTGVGERTRTLFRGLSWNVPAMGISRVLCGLATLMAARWIGPAEFGQANLALAATFWIQIPLFFGVTTALTHYTPKAVSKERSDWVAAALILFAATGGATLAVGYAFRTMFARLQGIPLYFFDLGLAWCAGYFLYIVLTTLFNALENFRARALCELAFALMYPSVVVFMRLSQHLNAAQYVYSLAWAYGLVGFLGLSWKGLVYYRARVKSEYLLSLLSYGAIAAVGSLVSALLNSPSRLVANRYLTLSEVGVLSAYQGGSIQMAAFFLMAIAQVFFPIASRTPNKAMLLKKLTRILVASAPALLIFFAAVLWSFFTLLGRRYPLHFPDLAAYSLAAVLSMCYGLLAWFLASQGRRGVAFSTATGLVAGVVNLGACFLLIPRWGIAGGGWAYALGSVAGIACYYLPNALNSPNRQSCEK